MYIEVYQRRQHGNKKTLLSHPHRSLSSHSKRMKFICWKLKIIFECAHLLAWIVEISWASTGFRPFRVFLSFVRSVVADWVRNHSKDLIKCRHVIAAWENDFSTILAEKSDLTAEYERRSKQIAMIVRVNKLETHVALEYTPWTVISCAIIHDTSNDLIWNLQTHRIRLFIHEWLRSKTRNNKFESFAAELHMK